MRKNDGKGGGNKKNQGKGKGQQTKNIRSDPGKEAKKGPFEKRKGAMKRAKKRVFGNMKPILVEKPRDEDAHARQKE